MAEKYGTIPPKYTKEWWAYFWEYYRWHVIITVAAVLITAVTIAQCASRPVYDEYVTYAGHKQYSDKQAERIEQLMAAEIEDADGNGENAVLLRQLMFSDTAGSEEYDYALQTKLDLSMSDECTFVYLFDKALAERQLSKTSVGDLFVPVSEWSQSSDVAGLAAADGTVYAASLTDSSVLKENDLYNDDLYIMVKRNYKDDEKNNASFSGAFNIARMFIK